MNSVNEKRIEGMNALTVAFLKKGLLIKGSAHDYKEVDLLLRSRDISDEDKSKLRKKWLENFGFLLEVLDWQHI